MNELLETTEITISNLDNIELQIKQEQAELKKGLPANFISEVQDFIEMCFMLPKNKKENFITKEKLKSILYKIIRSQKKFKNPENFFGEIRYLAVFDKEKAEIGKLISLDMLNNTAEFITYYDKMNGYDSRVKHWRDIYLFDYNSPQLEAMYNQYQSQHQRELSFVDMTHFLEMQDFIKSRKTDKTQDYGIELVKAEEHPVMKTVMLEYKIPENVIKKGKKKLLKLDPITMAILEEFDSVKDASDKLIISASTISNVLCQGGSAIQYREAGGFRWQYSDKPNSKY